MNEHDAKTANAVLKEFDKESDTMEYTGLMKKIVALIAICFSVFQLYTASNTPTVAV